jgi:DNA end-binding protein Ku
MAAIVWRGFISFGLVSFPVRLFAAARPKGIHFHMLHNKDLSRVKEILYCEAEDKPISRSDIVKGIEIRKGSYVVVTDEELKKVAPPTASTMDILQFVRAGDVDPIFLETSYYVAPEETVSKPYFLLMQVMSEVKQYSLAKITMHGREHIAILRPTGQGMVLHTLYFVDELQSANAPAISAGMKLSAKDVQLAKTLIHNMVAPFKPAQYHDEYRANVEHLLQQKQRGQKVTAITKPKPRTVVNITAALRRSVAQSRKSRLEKAVGKKVAGKRSHEAA